MDIVQLGKLIYKANNAASQVGKEYKKAKEQYKQKQQNQEQQFPQGFNQQSQQGLNQSGLGPQGLTGQQGSNQQGLNGQQYGGSQQQGGPLQQHQSAGYPPSLNTNQSQQQFQGYQSPLTPQPNQGYRPPSNPPPQQQQQQQQQHQQYQQYAPPQQYQAPPQQNGYPTNLASPQNATSSPQINVSPPQTTLSSPQTTLSSPHAQHGYQNLQSQLQSNLQTVEGIQAEFERELAAATAVVEQLNKEYQEKLKMAELEVQRLMDQHEERLKQVQLDFGSLTIQNEQANASAVPSRPISSIGGPSPVQAPGAQGGQPYYPPPPEPSPHQHRYSYQHNPDSPAVPIMTPSTDYSAPSFATPATPATPAPSENHQQQPQQQQTSYQPSPNLTSGQEMHPCGTVPLAECVAGPIPAELDWFTHAAAPEFLICSRCYVDHIYNTPFRSSFTLTHVPSSPPRKCLFGTRRMKDTLWPAAVSSSSLGSAIEFMQRRQNIPHCSGSALKKGTAWYTTPSIPNLTVCQACYEDLLMSCSFGSHFSLTPGIDGYCDGSTVYINRMLERFAATDDWSAFVTQVQARLNFPPCEKLKPVASTERTWFEANRGPKGMIICATCYCDYFYNTPDQERWVQTVPQSKETVCLLGNPNACFTADRAVQKEDNEIFWKAMEEGYKHPPCSPHGTKGTQWYALPNNAKDFLVCGACFATVVNAYGGSSWFVPQPSSTSSEAHLCALNIVHPRFGSNFTTFIESVFRGSPKVLADYAAAFANVPACPRNDAQKGVNRRWWGWDNAQICEECYLTFAKGTSLESRFTLQGVHAPDARVCDMYSPRMRGLYTETCSSGDLQNLLNFALHRKRTLLETGPKIERMRLEQQMQLNRSHTAALIANSTKFMGDVQGSHGYTVGSSSMGYGYANEMSYQGAVEQRQAREMADQAVDGRVDAEIDRLIKELRDVE